MKVLCALGARDGAALVERLLARLTERPLDLALVFVIDEGPRHGLEALRGPLGRGPRMGPDRRRQIDQAEARGGEAVLAEAQALAARAEGVAVAARMERGSPERVIVALAAELASELIVVGAREGMGSLPPGPESVGRVARYVLDHAPCDVWLVRR